MTRPIGFSTGALALADFRRALRMLRRRGVGAVELSTLREAELAPLLESLDSLELADYAYVSLHAPSRFQSLAEEEVARLLKPLLARRWPIIVHPDALTQQSVWQEFGDRLCIENMDKRKRLGRTVEEMQEVFDRFPAASFCFDIGHARQIDPTMSQAALMLRRFGARLRQVHVSEVNSRNGHDPISFTAQTAFRRVAHLVPPQVPLILEMVIPEDQIDTQMAIAAEALTARPVMAS
jgi:sugar phosphate isomerase/epimerase